MTIILTKNVSERHKKLVRHYVNRLRDTSKKFMIEKFNDEVTPESFNIMLNSNMQYFADVIYLLSTSVESPDISHIVLEKVKLMFEEYMKDIKEKIFN